MRTINCDLCSRMINDYDYETLAGGNVRGTFDYVVGGSPKNLDICSQCLDDIRCFIFAKIKLREVNKNG